MEQTHQQLRQERRLNHCLTAVGALLLFYLFASSTISAWLAGSDVTQSFKRPPQASTSHSAARPTTATQQMPLQAYRDLVTESSAFWALDTVHSMTQDVACIAELFTRLFEDYFDETRVVTGNWIPGTAPKTGISRSVHSSYFKSFDYFGEAENAQSINCECLYGTAPNHGLRFGGLHHAQEFERTVSSIAEAMKEVDNTRRLADYETVGCRLNNETVLTMGTICGQDQDQNQGVSAIALAMSTQLLDDPSIATQHVFRFSILQAQGCARTARRHQKLTATLHDIDRMHKSLTRLLAAEEARQRDTALAWDFWHYWAEPARSLRSITHFSERLELAVRQSKYVTLPTAERMEQAGQRLDVRVANLTVVQQAAASGEQHQVARELACAVFAHEIQRRRAWCPYDAV